MVPSGLIAGVDWPTMGRIDLGSPRFTQNPVELSIPWIWLLSSQPCGRHGQQISRLVNAHTGNLSDSIFISPPRRVP
jgi:hypothetical protein